MRFVSRLLLLLLIFPTRVFAQPSGDTLEMAKQLRDRGEIRAAMKLLAPYHAAHPTDLNTAWMYAQTAYWAKQYKRSQQIYDLAIWYHPENLYLQLDYVKMLVDIGKPDKAMPYLEHFLICYPDDAQAQLILAKITFWQGRYREAISRTSDLLSSDPADPDAVLLHREILRAKSPWIGLTGSFYTDNQPLQTISPMVESGFYLHPLSTVHFRVRAPFFSRGGSFSPAVWIETGNRSMIWKGNWNITLAAGVLKYPYKNTIDWTGNLEVEKISCRHLASSLKIERKPYFSTVSSVDTVIRENHLTVAIGWNDFTSWNGQVAFHLDHFPADRNNIYALSAWMFTPPLKIRVFDFRIGTGFSYTTSDENRFEPADSRAEIIASYDSAEGIRGIYNPYFTPDDQRINSLLVSMDIHPAKGIDLGFSGNLGLYATAQIPYFFLDQNGAGSYVVKKGSSKERYFPFVVNGYAELRPSTKLSLRAEYAYHSTWYYQNHYAGLTLKISIWNAKGRQ